MLAKMGFKPGNSLGKDGTGRTEPVPINIKGKGFNRYTVDCAYSDQCDVFDRDQYFDFRLVNVFLVKCQHC